MKNKTDKVKRNISSVWEQYKRERKENHLEIVTGYLDFGYEAMQALTEIYQIIFAVIAVFTCHAVENDVVNEIKLVFDLQGLSILMIFVLCIYMLYIFKLTVFHRNGIMGRVAAVIAWYSISMFLLRHGVAVFSLKGIIGVYLSAVIIKKILTTVIEVKELPSRNIIIRYCADVHRKKTGYWWY